MYLNNTGIILEYWFTKQSPQKSDGYQIRQSSATYGGTPSGRDAWADLRLRTQIMTTMAASSTTATAPQKMKISAPAHRAVPPTVPAHWAHRSFDPHGGGSDRVDPQALYIQQECS